MPLDLSYTLNDSGWASIRIRDKHTIIDLGVSYLHDSLRDLAEAAISIRDGSPSAKVIFMDEPGEAHLVLTREDDVLRYDLRWYHDWYSWGLTTEDNFKVLHHGNTLEWEFLDCVRRQLQSILAEYGEEGYLKNWIEHPFPIEFYNILLNKS